MADKDYSAAFTAPGPQLPALAPAKVIDIDPNAAVRQALAQNGEIVGSLLRSIQPPGPPVDGGNVVGTYSTPGESAGRTSRYKFAVGAIAVIAVLTATGLVMVMRFNGVINDPMAFGLWFVLSGAIMGGLVAWLQTLDFRHSAEGIALEREWYQHDLGATDAQSRQEIAAAIAYAIRKDADAKALTVASQAHALDAEVARLAAPTARALKQVTVAGTAQPQAWEWDAAGNPVVVAAPAGDPVDPPVAPPVAPPDTPPVAPLSPPVGPGVDPVMGAVLAWVAGLYDDPAAVDPATRRVLAPLPWSARSKVLAPADKARVKAAILGLDPPLFLPAEGNGVTLVCPLKGAALKKVRAGLG